ncbi:two-component system response regulator [Gammaproteobacteria bacterium 42_54_T18]|nr:two-component system response regulator [Gammaproteobacteria bacterium 42_54_T18]
MSNMTILLVEDNPDDEMLAIRALKKTEIKSKVVVARDGEEALDYLFGTGKYNGRDIKEQPHVVFLDLQLPKLNGIQVLQRLRANENTKALPVVLLTSSDEQCDIIDCYKSGANSYIHKPVEFSEFTAQVRALGEYWLGINRVPDRLDY